MTTSTAAPGLVHLIERNPEVSGAEMVASLTPPPQFHNATFDTYRADAAYPSQQESKDQLMQFSGLAPSGSAEKSGKRPGLFSRKPKVREQPPGVYLDGGFGVGKTHLLASIYHAITQLVPSNPDAPEFRLGKALGNDHTHWRRVKKGMPDRYRLFFRFSSAPVKVIVYVWFNDEYTLRKAGSKTDVYAAFKRMLARGVVPSDIGALLAEGQEA